MKILIISDLHCSNSWEIITSKHINSVDKIIFLGDYLDSKDEKFYDNLKENTLQCINNLKNIIRFKRDNPLKVELLLGNHDIPYFTNIYITSDNIIEHMDEIGKIFIDNIKLFNLIFIEDNWIFSHSGITEEFWNKTKELYKKEFNTTITLDKINNILHNNLNLSFNEDKNTIIDYHWLSVGKARGGSSEFGSLIWADRTELFSYDKQENRTYHGLKNYFQAVGHNKVSEIKKYIDIQKNQGIIFTDNITHKKNEIEYIIIDTKNNVYKKFRIEL